MSKTIGEVWVDTYADQLEKISTLEKSFNRITLDLVEAKRNHALELGERLKGEERVKELEAELCRFKLGMGDDYGDDPVLLMNTLKEKLEQAEARIKELEKERIGMVRLTKEDMKKLGWSYT